MGPTSPDLDGIWMGFGWIWIIFAALPDHQNESLEDFHGL